MAIVIIIILVYFVVFKAVPYLLEDEHDRKRRLFMKMPKPKDETFKIFGKQATKEQSIEMFKIYIEEGAKGVVEYFDKNIK